MWSRSWRAPGRPEIDYDTRQRYRRPTSTGTVAWAEVGYLALLLGGQVTHLPVRAAPASELPSRSHFEGMSASFGVSVAGRMWLTTGSVREVCTSDSEQHLKDGPWI